MYLYLEFECAGLTVCMDAATRRNNPNILILTARTEFNEFELRLCYVAELPSAGVTWESARARDNVRTVEIRPSALSLARADSHVTPVKLWTTDSKLKIREGFESVIQIWTGDRQFSDPANALN